MLSAAAMLMKLLAVPLLFRIAKLDFTTHRIANSNVLLLLCLGAASLFLAGLGQGSWWDLGLSAAAGLALFLALFPFWLLKKVGAGDVKLMAAAPFVSGGADLMVFAIALLVFAIVTVMVVRNPVLLPSPAFRVYVEHLDRRRVVPFGVPIAAALIVTIGLQLAAQVLAAWSS